MDTLHSVLRSINTETKSARDHLTKFREFLVHLDQIQRKSPAARPSRAKAGGAAQGEQAQSQGLISFLLIPPPGAGRVACEISRCCSSTILPDPSASGSICASSRLWARSRLIPDVTRARELSNNGMVYGT